MGDPYEKIECSWCGQEHRLAYSHKRNGLPYCSPTCREKDSAKANSRNANRKVVREAREKYEQERYQQLMVAAAAAAAREKKQAEATAEAASEAAKAAMARFYDIAKADMLREKEEKQLKRGGYSRKLRKNCK